ncbi:MAG TPA: methyltransferase [Xanthobacteraceae bacterium]|nr:methyltransferase [Xanthobacteraceae bacterium]
MRAQLPQSPADTIINLLHQAAMSQAAYVAAELGIADYLSNAPQNAHALAKATGAHERSLHRLLRALVSTGLCIEQDDGCFALTPAGALMHSTADESLHSWLLWFGRNQWAIWGHLLDTVRTGESARKRTTGNDGFELLENVSTKAPVFNMAMVQQTRLIGNEVVRAFDFAEKKTIVDVGGGQGALLEVILNANARLHGVLMDRPHAITGARQRFNEAGLLDRCDFVTGDFFAAIPAGAGVYLLKNVIHDWDDERALHILRNCREAMASDGTLLLIERIRPTRIDASPAHRAITYIDLTMMLGPGGQERTEAEFRALLQQSGLMLASIRPMAMGYVILEAAVDPIPQR